MATPPPGSPGSPAQVDLESSHCQLFYVRGLRLRLSTSEPPCTDPVQDQGGRGEGSTGCALLAHPNLGMGTIWHPIWHPVEPPGVVPGRGAADLAGLPQAEDPQRCSIGVVLAFLQEGLEQRLSPSTLKVYVAAIAAYHDALDGRSLGKHHLVTRLLRGARRLNPPRPRLFPSWDLSVVLLGLQRAPFEPLSSVELKFLSLKTMLLTALASIKRVGDLQAVFVNEACLDFGPSDSHMILRPRPGYVPKVPTTPFRDQVVNLQALPLEEADLALALLCPVRALRIYVDRTRGTAEGECCLQTEVGPLGGRCHHLGVRVPSASLADICRAAGWATPNIFARFYNLHVEPVSSHVLT
ncbi:Protein translocase subunit SecA 2 [Labeo rohita]|uniref:Protein translocase subunit SecA 2 n=1 Tax=Labeo rohita TaxID=84645 RepID=A0ABQ8LP49_LABRO|nr:Protein translocase subunit SecA 2 [Labeo rohita]